MPLLNLLGLFLARRWSWLWVWLVALACAFGIFGCAQDPAPVVAPKIAQGLVRKVCWLPEELDPNTQYFVFLGDNGEIVSDQNKSAFASAVVQAGLIYEYDTSAPVENLRLIPLTRPDAWCNDVPKPTDEAVVRLLNPCADSPAQQNGSAPKNLLAQTNVTEHSSYFCQQNPQMPPTGQELILRREREAAFMAAFRQARAIATALTQAEADMLRVINNDDGWLKRLFLDDPGTLEQIQLRVASQLDSIEPPPEYNNKYLDTIALSGFRAGFEDGKFEVEDKLYAIDVGILVLEVVAVEIATAGVGGVALAAARTGARAVKFTSTAGGKALVAAMKRLENVPIFIPVATGGLGTYVTVGQVIKAVRTSASKKLADAMIKAGIKRPDGTDAHHIVAIGHKLAEKSREILAKFGVKLDQAENGAFLPSNLKSPNPKGAIVHATLANKRLYYEIVEEALLTAKSQQDVLRILKRIRQTLEDGTFYHARL